ncbi:YncE family protein [Pseudomonas sp. NPDC089734]|uniref:YncE family protein n=1 Tax=Pseudomonas sp. NPDC089734 TaxID=3364469 RepID=UPI003826641E
MQRKIFSSTDFLNPVTDFPSPVSSSHGAMLLDSIPLAFAPKDIDVSVEGHELFVSHEDGSGVSVINIAERQIVSTIERSGGGDIAVSPEGETLYVAGEHECVVIDIQRCAIKQVIDAEGIDRVAASPDGRFICMTFRDAPGGLIRVLETAEYKAESDFDLGRMSNATLVMALSPDSRYIYAAEISDDPDSAVAVIDTVDYSQVDIPGFRNPCSMAVSREGRYLYVGGFDEMFIADTTTHRIHYALEFGSRGYPVNVIGVTPDEKYVYAIHTCNFDLYRIDTQERTAERIDVFESVGGAVLNREGTRLYTTHPDRQWVSIYAL